MTGFLFLLVQESPDLLGCGLVERLFLDLDDGDVGVLVDAGVDEVHDGLAFFLDVLQGVAGSVD